MSKALSYPGLRTSVTTIIVKCSDWSVGTSHPSQRLAHLNRFRSTFKSTSLSNSVWATTASECASMLWSSSTDSVEPDLSLKGGDIPSRSKPATCNSDTSLPQIWIRQSMGTFLIESYKPSMTTMLKRGPVFDTDFGASYGPGQPDGHDIDRRLTTLPNRGGGTGTS
eukprot:3935157-Rhodomonas_salina.1